MRSELSAAIVAASMLASGAAGAACPRGSPASCVDFNLIPQISDQVVAAEKIAKPAKSLAIPDKEKPYTGPTIGVVPHSVGRAAEVGYRWAIN